VQLTSLSDTKGMTANGGYVYFADAQGMHRVSSDGGCPELFIATSTLGRWDFAPPDFYYQDGSAVFRIPLAGGAAPTQVLTFSTSGFFEGVNATHIFWYDTNPSGLRRMPLAGGPVELVYPVGSVIVDDTDAYWDDYWNGIFRLTFATGVVTNIAGVGANHPGLLTMDDTAIAWTNTPHGGIKWQFKAPGGAYHYEMYNAPTSNVTFGGPNIYWTTLYDGLDIGLMAELKAGGPLRFLATDTSDADLTADISGVYVARSADGRRIYKIAP
jgi:hypothetical protein